MTSPSRAANPFAALLDGVDADRPCLYLDDARWTYGDLGDRAARFAAALGDLGVTAGERVVVQVDKSPDAVALYLSCLRIGAVYVPLNTAYTRSEVAAFVADAEPRVLVTRPDRASTATATVSAADTEPVASAAVTGPPVSITLGADGDGRLADLAATADPDPTVVDRSPDDWAAMLYTSGTTGRSKGAMLSCQNLTSNADALVRAWRFEPDDVLVHALPVFHVHGLFVALHCAFAVGAAVRLHPRFDVARVLDDLATSTVFMGVPTHYHRLLAEPGLDAPATAGMRLFTSGSAPLPAAEHDAFTARTGHRIVERYGLTETMIVTSNPYDGDRRAGTVGYPLDGIEVRIADDDGGPAPPGRTGIVEVRGPNVCLGYWGRPEHTESARRVGGWFVTGDVGSLEADGRLTLEGRAGDMIISGGLNVYPKEIELVLDAVDGVDESAVVGVPHPDLGEQVVAVIVAGETPPDETDLRAACDAGLARFKHPRRYLVVDDLPRNAMGKVTKAVLRAELAERWQDGDEAPASEG